LATPTCHCLLKHDDVVYPVSKFSKPEGPLVSRYAENAIYCKLSPGPGSQGRSLASTPLPWPWPLPHPTRTEVAAVHCVLTVKKGGSLRSATTPTKGNRLLISLPVEQQLLELKPNGLKICNSRVPTSSGRRESSTWLVHPPDVPLQVRCASETRRQASGERHFPPVAHPSPHCFGPWPFWPSSVGLVCSLCSPVSPFPDHATQSKGLGRL
jgi:hypothetical protein